MNVKRIQPQEGFQQKFLSSPADIVIGGGSAGAGKSFALMMEYLRHINTPNWQGVVFRRTYQQIAAAGGLWDTGVNLYSQLAAPGKKSAVKLNNSKYYFEWPSRSRLNFSHLQHEKDKLNWQGAQIGYLAFDELTQFTPTQFFYLLTRNRSAAGVRPYCRCTTNPQGSGWVKDIVQWWLYPDDYPDEKLAGFPIAERAGALRYFTRYRGKFVWADTPEGVLEKLPAEVAREYKLQDVKSLTFIPGLLTDNKILTELDPNYKGNLLAQDEELMQQLLLGRWVDVRDDSDRLFPYAELGDVFSNTFVPHGEKYITADVALEGADMFTVGVWSGWRLTNIYTYAKTTGKQVLEHIRKIAQVHGVPASHIVVDTDGVGGYLPSFLRGAHSFHNGASPIKQDGQAQAYENLKTQCYFHAATKVKGYEAYIETDNEKLIETIMTEMYAHRKVIKDNGKLGITPKSIVKEEIGNSPDYADMFIMRSYFDLVRVKSSTSSTAL